jgi:trigger factor
VGPTAPLTTDNGLLTNFEKGARLTPQRPTGFSLMKSELVDVSPTRKEIKIEIDPQTVRDTYNRISDNYARQVNVPGFRKGHAPRSVVKTRFKNEIRGDVLRELVPDAINEAIDKHELAAIGEPDVQLDNAEALERFGEEPIAVSVNVEVWPEIELNPYKGLELKRRVRPIKDEDVEVLIENLREASAALQPVEDRAAEIGDTVTANFHGSFVDHPESEDLDLTDVDVELGGERVQPEFTENLKGTRPDDQRSFTVDYPADFSSKGLAGKKVDYTATVTAVRIKELPELDDEWAQSLGEDIDSLATLRTKIREDLEKRAATEADNVLRADLMKQVVTQHSFEVPLSLINRQTHQRMERLIQNMFDRGVDPRNSDLDWDSAHKELQAQAEEEVRGSILLQRIADAEKITVSNEEIEAEIDAIATASRQSKEQVRAVLTKDGGERSIAGRLRNSKALDLLLENARITEEEWRDNPESEISDQKSA